MLPSDPITLSVVIPAYNEERRLGATLTTVSDFLCRQSWDWEIRVVDDGSVDGTVRVGESLAAGEPRIVVQREPHRGKGGAVKAGLVAASSAYRFICDADLSMPIEELAKFLPPQLEGYDVAIGSREAPGARRYNEPLFRHAQGRVFSLLVKLFAMPGFEDTQCGFKCFRAEIADDLFRVQVFDGMSFDVEVLYIARKRGYRIVEVPIGWYYQSESRVRPLTDPLRMLLDILAIRRNWWRGRYEKDEG
jgi:dolichyl-phosphate beta-glucosyltransferase